MNAKDEIIPKGVSVLIKVDGHPERNGVLVDQRVMEATSISDTAKAVYAALCYKYLDTKLPIPVREIMEIPQEDFRPGLEELMAVGLVEIRREGKDQK